MATIKIRTESLPSRCEICHQKDLFDPVSNHCQRCSSITIVDNQQPTVIQENTPRVHYPRDHNYGAHFAIISSVLIGVLLGCGFNWLFQNMSLLSFGLFDLYSIGSYISLIGVLFQIGLWSSYGISQVRGWIDTSRHNTWDRVISVVIIQLAFLLIAICFQTLFLVAEPFILPVALIGSLRLITGRWNPLTIIGLLGVGGFSFFLLIFSLIVVDIYYPILAALYNLCFIYGLIHQEPLHQNSPIHITPTEREQFLRRQIPAYRDHHSDEPGPSWF